MLERALDPKITIQIVIRVVIIAVRIEREGMALGAFRFRLSDLHRILEVLRDILELQ